MTATFTEIKFIDLFCGVGGIRFGVQQQSILRDLVLKEQSVDVNNLNASFKKELPSFTCVFSCDIDKECQRIYSKNFGDTPAGDITLIQEETVPSHDLLCAGFPCQPFSISGKQFGFEDTRGTLFFDIARLIDAKRPSMLLLENVKNLLHHNGGHTLEVILTVLKKFGYHISYAVLNAKNFGIPQNRERLILVGVKSQLTPFDFSSLTYASSTTMKDFFTRLNKAFPSCPSYSYLNLEDYTLIPTPTINPKSGLIFVGYRNKPGRQKGVRANTQHLSRAHRQCNRIYALEGTHPTLSAQEKSGRYFILDETRRVRKLTLDECWHLMGFPLSFFNDSAIATQYHQLGNSVCVPMIASVIKAMSQQIIGII